MQLSNKKKRQIASALNDAFVASIRESSFSYLIEDHPDQFSNTDKEVFDMLSEMNTKSYNNILKIFNQ